MKRIKCSSEKYIVATLQKKKDRVGPNEDADITFAQVTEKRERDNLVFWQQAEKHCLNLCTHEK